MCFELQGLLNDTNRMSDAKARLSTLNTKERSEQLIQIQVVSFVARFSFFKSKIKVLESNSKTIRL